MQSAERDGRMSNYEEQLLTRVMLENNLDAVFVGPLEQMAVDGTDALCLSKIPANSIVLGWLPPEAVALYLERLGLPWNVREKQSGKSPAVRYFQIRTDQPIDELMSSLLQILRNISIKTLQIAMPTATSRASMPIQPAVSGQHSQLKPAELAKAERPLTQPADPQLTQAGSPDRQQQSLPMRPFAPAMAAGLEPRDELDQLVDDLESLDL